MATSRNSRSSGSNARSGSGSKRSTSGRRRAGDAGASGADPCEQLDSGEVGRALIEGNSFGIKSVAYSVVGGRCIIEGDIDLGSVADVAAQTQVLHDVMSGARSASVIVSGNQFRWPNCTVPFEIDGGLANPQRVRDAIAHWESNTRFRFVERTAANQAQFPDWVRFVGGSGCSSAVGKRGGRQDVTLGTSCTVGNTIHEIGHVVGLWHEQSREDRDAFVTVMWANIQAGREHNFNQHISDGDDVGAYDYGSIMHYPRNAFSANGQDTLVPTQAGVTIGQRTALSAGDIAAANSMCPLIKQPKEIVKDLIDDPIETRKELVKDTFKDIRKDVVDDPIGTRKELVADPTIKEGVLDPTIKEGAFDPPRLPIERLRPGVRGVMPFGVATPADRGVGQHAGIAELDAQIEQLLGALGGVEVARAAVEQRIQELVAMRDALAAELGLG